MLAQLQSNFAHLKTVADRAESTFCAITLVYGPFRNAFQSPQRARSLSLSLSIKENAINLNLMPAEPAQHYSKKARAMRFQGYPPSIFGRDSNQSARLLRHPRTSLVVTNMYI